MKNEIQTLGKNIYKSRFLLKRDKSPTFAVFKPLPKQSTHTLNQDKKFSEPEFAKTAKTAFKRKRNPNLRVLPGPLATRIPGPFQEQTEIAFRSAEHAPAERT
jgi:hypothetical protein